MQSQISYRSDTTPPFPPRLSCHHRIGSVFYVYNKLSIREHTPNRARSSLTCAFGPPCCKCVVMSAAAKSKTSPPRTMSSHDHHPSTSTCKTRTARATRDSHPPLTRWGTVSRCTCRTEMVTSGHPRQSTVRSYVDDIRPTLRSHAKDRRVTTGQTPDVGGVGG